MIELFLICALALPAENFTMPPIVRYGAIQDERARLEDWLKKNNPDAEIFIHPEPQEDVLKKNGWERVPFTWRGNHIWINRKPKTDKQLDRSS